MQSKADSVRLYKIRKAISELSSKEGRGTELVSLYIPPKKPIHEVIAYLRNEWGTAGNIKSDTTRNHVQDALTKTMQRLKLYRETPETGLVIFCGALPTNGPGSEVIRMNEIIPPKAVTTYLYMCVAPETRVLMDDGREKAIGELKSSWRDERVMSWDAEERKLVDTRVQDYLKVPVGDRGTYRLTVESGRSIVATEDHPFKTPRGWVRLGLLKKGDLVCVLPQTEDGAGGPAQDSGPEELIVDEESLRGVPDLPKNLRLTINRLKDRGLLPLSSHNPKLPIIARILGHLLSDGSMVHTMEERPSGPYSYFTLDFCLGSKADEEGVRNDLAKLGYELPEGRETTYEMNVEGRAYTGHVRHTKLRDAAVCTLLRALGASEGDKVKNGVKIPAWLLKAPLGVQKEFLAAYLGGDVTVPRMVGRNLVSQSSVGFHRIVQKEESGLEFAGQLTELLSNFGIAVNRIERNPGYRRKDGFDTLESRLRFKLSEENVLRLCSRIGIRYCSKKAMSVNLVGEYLRIKARLREETRAKMRRARQLSAEGLQVKQIGQLLVTPSTTVSQWIHREERSPKVRSTQLPSFEEWSKMARTGLEEPLLWESVASIETEVIHDVRDLTVTDGSHSFFANGFLVHNCDDHFHIEYLRDMLKAEKVYGILSIDSNDVGMGILSGDRLDVVDTMTSGISGKTRKGGQSARRYERGREMEVTYFFNRVSEHTTRAFINDYHVGGIIVGGPGPTKENFLKGGYLDYRLQKNVIEVIDTSYSGREGIREIVEKASDKLQNVRLIEEKKLVQRFLAEVSKPNGLGVYGLQRVIDALNRNNIETILCSDDLNTSKVTMTCKNCQTVKEKVVQSPQKIQVMQEMLSEPCLKCGSMDYESSDADVVDTLEEKAIQVGARVEMISSGTEEGMMLKSFGGVGGFLRYRT